MENARFSPRTGHIDRMLLAPVFNTNGRLDAAYQELDFRVSINDRPSHN
jgi:hypothetical protein